MIMKNQNNLRQMLTDGYVLAPCIYDCLSARAAELCGFKALMLSGCALAWSMIGMPDIGLLTADELIEATSRITDSCELPLMVDTDEGYGESPIHTYRTACRLVKAGAAALQIDDCTGIKGYERVITGQTSPIIGLDIWKARIKAALDAVSGTNCMIIARTNVLRKMGIEAAIERCLIAHELGAQITLVLGLNKIDDCIRISNEVPGWKMYPDITTTNGKADVSIQDIVKLGFNLTTMHYTEYGAMWGMMYYGMENFKNKNCEFSDNHAMGGLSWPERWNQLSPHYLEWLEREKEWYK